MTTLLKNRLGIAPATEVSGLGETTAIEQDRDLYTRVLQRLANPVETIVAEVVLGRLDEDEKTDCMTDQILVHRSDLEKIHDVLVIAAKNHKMRDEMNAALHLAPATRFSPLTSELIAERDRVAVLLNQVGSFASGGIVER